METGTGLKVLRWGILVVILALIAFLIYKLGGFFNVFDTSEERKEKKESEKEKKEREDEIEKEVEKTGQKLSYYASQYKDFADKIFEAVRFSAADDDNAAAVKALIQMKNNADVMQLITEFGTRTTKIFGIDHRTLTLLPMMQAELYSKEITAVNNNWAQKGISYRI